MSHESLVVACSNLRSQIRNLKSNTETTKFECCCDYNPTLTTSQQTLVELCVFSSEHHSANAIGNTLAPSGSESRPTKAENSRYLSSPNDMLPHKRAAGRQPSVLTNDQCRWLRDSRLWLICVYDSHKIKTTSRAHALPLAF